MKVLIAVNALLALVYVGLSKAAIYDPLNVFCGQHNCYEILGVQKDAPIKDIKKAFRRMSLTQHPDKNKEANATEVFRLISKAYEVLTGNESRPLFDYYLAHPTDYFKVSGQHYYRNLPKSDVRLVILVVIGLISWLFHSIQMEKYRKAVSYLKKGTLENLSLKNGGSKQTLELYRRAATEYDEQIKELKANGNKNAGKFKMLKDPLFEKIVDKVVSEVKIEGGYRKPTWEDLFAVRLAKSPYSLFLYAQKYHRRYISKKPLPMEDKIEMARDRLGLAIWEEQLTEDEQKKFIEMEIWKEDVYNQWLQEKEEEYQKAMKAVNKGKAGKRRKMMRQQEEDDGANEYIE